MPKNSLMELFAAICSGFFLLLRCRNINLFANISSLRFDQSHESIRFCLRTFVELGFQMETQEIIYSGKMLILL